MISSAGTYLLVVLLGFLGGISFFFKRIIGFFKKDKRRVLYPAVLILIITGIITMMTIQHRKTDGLQKRVVILGFDGLSPAILESLMKEGALPHFTALAEQGSYRHLSTTNPPQSPVAWTGFATGQNPGKNGIFDFIKRDPKTYGLDLATSNMEHGVAQRVVRSKCFWEYASDMDVPSVIISCPLTFPPSKIKGRMLSGMGVPDILGTEGTFSFYTSEAISSKKDIGGNVVNVEKGPVMRLHLIGPKKSLPGGGIENIKIPFTVTPTAGQDGVMIEVQNQKFPLKVGAWSGWKKVSFPIHPFKNMKGIFQFHLVETIPEFKLYAGPINFDPADPSFQLSYPADYAKELSENIGLFYTRGMPMDTWAVNENRLSEKAFLEQANEVLRERTAMLDFELNRFQKGILFCYFDFPDTIQHMFWRYTDPQHPLYEKSGTVEYGNMIKMCYERMDEILGDVMHRVHGDDLLIVLSDHGFNTFRRTVHLNRWLRENNYLFLKDPDAESGGELLEDVDWSKTRAYAIGFGAIYINQNGREGNGIVHAGEETDMLKKEIAGKLEKWVDPKFNQRVVSKVYSKEEIFWGDGAADGPDLFVGFNVGYRASWQTAVGGVPGTTIEDNIKKWSGDHLFDPRLVPGIILSNRKLPDTPSLYDITPTILKTIGYGDAEIEQMNFDGNSFF